MPTLPPLRPGAPPRGGPRIPPRSRPGALPLGPRWGLTLCVALSPVLAYSGRDGNLAAWSEQWALCAAGADLPLPPLSPADLRRLGEGEVVRVKDRRGDHTRALGVLRSDVPRDRLWLSALDPHFAAAEEVQEHRLSPEGQWPNLWYQILDLPVPFADRHWVIDVWNNTPLAQRSEGRCWEHAWRLHSGGLEVAGAAARGELPGVDAARAAEAIYTPVNEGAWWVITLPDGSSLLGYHVTTVIDGQIPDDLVVAYTWSTLGRVLRGVVGRAADVGRHYDPAHQPLQGGDGRPLPPNP